MSKNGDQKCSIDKNFEHIGEMVYWFNGLLYWFKTFNIIARQAFLMKSPTCEKRSSHERIEGKRATYMNCCSTLYTHKCSYKTPLF